MSAQASYKPSPLSYGSPRNSPFRRPESPASPSPLRNTTTATTAIPATTPTTSPTKAPMTPSRLNQSNTQTTVSTPPSNDTWTPRGLVASIPKREQEPSPTRNSGQDSGSQRAGRDYSSNRGSEDSRREIEKSPTRGAESPRFGGMIGARTTTNTNILDTNALAKLSPAQVRELREGFQILDRDGDGSVNREDVADMLVQLGLPATPSAISPFFPPSTPQTITLPHFLTTLSTLLSSLSPSSELLNAFAAFDDDDSGQIDLGELNDALLNTAPEPGEQPLTAREVEKVLSGFSGRRAFGGKSSVGGMGMHVAAPKRGEVFRYQEFVGAVAGGKGGKEDDA